MFKLLFRTTLVLTPFLFVSYLIEQIHLAVRPLAEQLLSTVFITFATQTLIPL